MTSSKKTIRRNLFKKNPYCLWCGVKMILPESLPEHSRGKIKDFSENTCTYQHNYSKFDIEKRRRNKKPGTILCKKCNEKLAIIEESQLSITELHSRSKRFKNKVS